MSGVAFLDLETTGLEVNRHELWEIGLIVDDVEYGWFVRPDLSTADPMALKIGRFYERWPSSLNMGPVMKYAPKGHPLVSPWWPTVVAAGEIAKLLDGRHLVGAVPWFDAAFLDKFLRANGQAGTWHYHLIDVEALAIGHAFGEGMIAKLNLPWKSDDLSRVVGIDPPTEEERHTALGDARWAKRIYERIVGGAVR